MTSETQVLYEEMEKLLSRISDDLASTLTSLDGNLKDIECGTHIKIPTGVGYVSCYRSQNALEMKVWLSDYLKEMNLTEPPLMNKNDEEYDEYLNSLKSDKL